MTRVSYLPGVTVFFPNASHRHMAVFADSRCQRHIALHPFGSGLTEPSEIEQGTGPLTLVLILRTACVFVSSSSLHMLMLTFRRYFSAGGGSGASSATKANLTKLFDGYRDDPNSPDTVGPDGCMKYFGNDLEVDLEGMDALAVMEIIQAPTMGEISRDGFVDGWAAVK